MAGMTENTSPNVNQAAPTDTTTEESSGKTVQLAQTAAAVQAASPGRGAEDSIAAEGVLTYRLVDPVLRFARDGGNLVVHWRDGGHTTLEDYLVFAQTDLPPALTRADGSVISIDRLVASIEGFDPGCKSAALPTELIRRRADGRDDSAAPSSRQTRRRPPGSGPPPRQLVQRDGRVVGKVEAFHRTGDRHPDQAVARLPGQPVPSGRFRGMEQAPAIWELSDIPKFQRADTQ